MANAEWIFTAITRVVRHDRLTFLLPASVMSALESGCEKRIKGVFARQTIKTASRMEKRFGSLCQQYQLADSSRGRDMNIDVSYLQDLLRRQGAKCCLRLTGCGQSLDESTVSVDRINSILGHIKGNVQLTCLQCNVLKRDRTHADLFG